MPRPKFPAPVTPAPVTPATTDPEWLTDALKDLPPIVKIADVAKCVQISTRQLRRDIASGKLMVLRAVPGVGSSRILIPRREVARYLTAMVLP